MTVSPQTKTNECLLETHDLSRSYGAFQAVKPVDLTLYPRDLIALVGPNGSGKSTLLMCLSGLLRPSSGTVLVGGFDLYRDERPARQRLAYVPDVPVFYHELTAWEHLRFIALAHNAEEGFEERAEKLLREFGLWEARDLYPHVYSRGMRLKLGLALAMIRPLSVLLLDEPSSALDPESTDELSAQLLDLTQTGAAVLLTTHDTHFAEMMNAKIWKIRDGSLSFE